MSFTPRQPPSRGRTPGAHWTAGGVPLEASLEAATRSTSHLSLNRNPIHRSFKQQPGHYADLHQQRDEEFQGHLPIMNCGL
jgi:hypothetical protein